MPALRRHPGPPAGPAASRFAGLPGRAGGDVSLAAAALAVFAAAAVLSPPGGGGALAEEAAGGPPAASRAGVDPCVQLPGPARFWLRYYPGERFWAGGGVPAQAWVAWTAWGCRRVPLPPPPGGLAPAPRAPESPRSEPPAPEPPAPEPPAPEPPGAPVPAGPAPEPQQPAPSPPPPSPPSQPEHPEPARLERPVDGAPDPGDDADALAAELRALANAKRRGMGLRALAADPDLDRLAARKAAEMVRLGYFAHQSPNYGSPFDMLAQAGVTFRSAAENLARAGDPAAAHAALMGSAGHRGNLLSRSFTHLGVGAAPGPDGIVFVQLFIER